MAADKKRKLVALLMVDDDDNEFEESDIELSSIIAAVMSNMTERNKKKRIEGYFENVIPQYRDDTFRSHFRLCRESVEILCQGLNADKNLVQQNQGGRPMIDLGKQICIFLWFSASKEPLRTISDRFDVTESTVLTTVRRVTKAILSIMTKNLIKWPRGQKAREVFKGFQKVEGISNVIGAIDGSHIPISGREHGNETYINRKISCLLLPLSCIRKMWKL